jgi:hypothetical protein
MKGIIFAELIGFLELHLGEAGADAVLVAADLPHGGAYTRVGTYPAEEALAIVGAASAHTGIDAATLLADYGSYLFTRFGALFPDIMAAYTDADSLLDHVGSHIHHEVTILYPDAQPPTVSTRHDGDSITVDYHSHRPLAHIAFGLIRQALVSYGDPRQLSWSASADTTRAQFTIAPAAKAA